MNPDLIDDTTVWTYADLRRLCKEIGVNANGKREKLVERIKAYHQCARPPAPARVGALGAVPSPALRVRALDTHPCHAAPQ